MSSKKQSEEEAVVKPAEQPEVQPEQPKEGELPEANPVATTVDPDHDPINTEENSQQTHPGGEVAPEDKRDEVLTPGGAPAPKADGDESDVQGTAAQEAVDQARGAGQQVENVQPGAPTVTEIEEGSPTPHETDINLDGFPVVQDPSEHAHDFATLGHVVPAVREETGEKEEYFDGEPMFRVEPASFQSTNSGFQARLASSVQAAIVAMQEDDKRTDAKILLDPSVYIGLPFEAVLTITRKES